MEFFKRQIQVLKIMGLLQSIFSSSLFHLHSRWRLKAIPVFEAIRGFFPFAP